MDYSLNDFTSMPSDPELLQRHLQNIGALPQPPTPEVLPPLAPPQNLLQPGTPSSTFLKPMVKPTTNVTEYAGARGGPEVPGTTHLPGLRSFELPEPPAGVPIAPGQPAIPGGGGVRPMVPPVPPVTPGIAPGAAAPGSVDFYQNELQRALAHRGDQLSDHPSFLGKVGHVLGRIGNIAGDIVAPATMSLIPGTDLYNRVEVNRAERNLAGAQREASEEALRGAQTKEAEARAAQLGEPSIVQDAAGNAVGWKDPKGGIHTADDPETPPALKTIIEKWQGKQVEGRGTVPTMVYDDLIHGGPNGGPRPNPKTGQPYTSVEAGEIAAGMATQKLPEGQQPLANVDQMNKALERVYQVRHPGQPLPPEFTLPPNATQKDYDHLDGMLKNMEATAASQDQKDIANGMRAAMVGIAQQGAQERAEKAGEEVVRGYKNGEEFIMSRAAAKEQGLQHIEKASDKDVTDGKQNFAALNDMGAKERNLNNSMKALDQGAYEKTLIQTALSGHPDDYRTRGAVALMSDVSKQYVQDVFSLREAALALPKQTTGGSRVSEQQAQALWNTIPGSAGDSKYGTSQLMKFDENLARLWKKVPNIEGQVKERPFGEKTGAGGGGVAAGGQTVKMGGKEYPVDAQGRITVNGVQYQTTPGSKQITRIR
jgi:hypothetical protein